MVMTFYFSCVSKCSISCRFSLACERHSGVDKHRTSFVWYKHRCVSILYKQSWNALD